MWLDAESYTDSLCVRAFEGSFPFICTWDCVYCGSMCFCIHESCTQVHCLKVGGVRGEWRDDKECQEDSFPKTPKQVIRSNSKYWVKKKNKEAQGFFLPFLIYFFSFFLPSLLNLWSLLELKLDISNEIEIFSFRENSLQELIDKLYKKNVRTKNKQT